MCSDFPPGNPIAARRLTITPNAGPFPLRTRSSCSTPRLRRRMQMSRRQQTRTTRRPQPAPSTPARLRSVLRLTTEIPTGPHHHGLADRIARAADGAHSGRPCGASSILPRDNGRAQRKYGYGRLTNLQCLLDFCRTSKRPPRQRRLARPGARGGSRGPRAPGPFRSTVGAPTYHNPEVIFNALGAFSSVNPSGQSCDSDSALD
jgi:hypothetical protein